MAWWWLTLALAVLCCAAGAIFLAWRRPRGSALGWARRLGAASALTVAVLLAAVLVLFPLHGTLPTTGEHAVAHVTVQYESDSPDPYRDGARRKISAEIYYPSGDGAKEHGHPLVVFSHGAMGSADQNASLLQELASHGYVVISVDHPGHSLWTTIDGATVGIDPGYVSDLRSEDARADPVRSLALYRQWMGLRKDDLGTAIDTAIAQSLLGAPVYGLIDTTRIAVAGHSLGGSAALGMGRARDDVSAAIALESPFMDDIVGVRDQQFVWRSEQYPVPSLNVYTDSSYGHLGEWPQYAANQRMLLGGDATAHSVHLAGCGHLSITDLTLATPVVTRMLDGWSTDAPGTDCLRRINTETVRFLDASLRS